MKKKLVAICVVLMLAVPSVSGAQSIKKDVDYTPYADPGGIVGT